MTEDQIKEALSNSYVGTLASLAGFKMTKAPDTGGVDYSVSKDIIRTYPGGIRRHLQAGNYIDIQLKSTTINGVVDYEDHVRYDLEAKSYNDLITRRDDGAAPLILVLFVLPVETLSWVEVTETNLILRHRAYWYKPNPDDVMTNNQNSVRIRIPKVNRFEVETWPNLYFDFFE